MLNPRNEIVFPSSGAYVQSLHACLAGEENADCEARVKAQTGEHGPVTDDLQAEPYQRWQMKYSFEHMEREAGDFFATAPVGFHWMATDGTILDINQTESQLLGCNREELIGRNLADFFPDRDVLANLLRRLANQETIRDAEVELRGRDGAIKRVLIDANVFQQGGQLVHVRCFVRDITERTQAEEALRRANDELELWVRQRTAELVRNNEALQNEIQQRRQVEEAILESEKRYRLIVETAEEGIWVMDAEDRTTFANRKMAQMLGYSADAMLGRSLFDFMDEAGRAIAGQNAAHGWQGVSHQRDFKFRHRDGTELWAQLATSAIVDDDGRYVGALAMVTDVTERKRAEQALRQSEEHYRELFHEAHRMQEKLRNLSNRILFAQEEERRRISRELHDEVGQALTAVNVNLAMLKRDAAQKRSAIARKIEDTQSLLEKTMVNVHRFARELRPAMLDDLGLIPALRSYMKDFGERTGIAVHLNAAVSDENLDGDQKTVLYRVAQESLNNIAKHAQARQVEATLSSHADEVCMEIKDDGQGFSLDAQTADKASKRLGLLGMEERVRLVNGTFSVQSTPNEGTVVLVRIPVRAGLKPTREGP